MSNRQNHFPSSHNPCSDKIGNIYSMYTTWKMTHPSRAGTTKHMYKKRKTKQGTTLGRGQQLPCEVDYHPVPRQWRTWKHTTWKYKKVKINASLTCDTMYSDIELSYLANRGWNAKRGRKDIAKWIRQPKGRQMKSGAPDLVSISCRTSATRHLQMSE